MSNLAHWNFALNFSGEEAAALILGLDPISDSLVRTGPIVSRMRSAYLDTLQAHLDALEILEWHDAEPWRPGRSNPDSALSLQMVNAAADKPFSAKSLHSWRMTSYYAAYRNAALSLGMAEAVCALDEDRFKRWLVDKTQTRFEQQLFERPEIARWVRNLGLTSVYLFAKQEDQPDNHGLSRIHRPGAPERRDLLTPVIEAAQRTCRDQGDAGEVWAALQSMAQAKQSPLLGKTETGIQYVGTNDTPKTLSYKALRERLRRAR